MVYLLDTNTVIAVLNDPSGPVAATLKTRRTEDVAVSSILLHELYYGAFKSQRLERNVALVDGLLFEILNFDPADAREAGQIRATLALAGTPIGPYDVLLAGQARCRDLTLVTDNEREFSRVPNLKLENWL